MNTRYRILVLTLLASASLMQPIFAGKVKAYTAKDADFPRYKTYQWLPPRVLTGVGVVENHPANPILKQAVERWLLQKGLSEVADGADLQIQAFVLTESVPQLEAVILAGDPYMMFDTPIATMGRYNRQGTLGINLIDCRTKKSAWAALATESLPNGTLSQDQIRSKLDKAATNIFKKYPVKK